MKEYILGSIVYFALFYFLSLKNHFWPKIIFSLLRLILLPGVHCILVLFCLSSADVIINVVSKFFSSFPVHSHNALLSETFQLSGIFIDNFKNLGCQFSSFIHPLKSKILKLRLKYFQHRR